MKTKGVIDGGLLLLLAGVALGIVGGSYKPFVGLKKGPETKKLEAAQAELAKAQEQARLAELAKEAAIQAERAKMTEQIRSAQGDALGVSTALNKVPTTPEIKVARAFAGRVNMKLAVAIGALPVEQQEAMIALVDGLIADTEDAKARLAVMDAEFKTLTRERDAIKAEIPKLSEEARKAKETALAAQSEVEAKTSQVAQWADKARAKELEAGSLGASFTKLLYIVAFLAASWAFLVFVLPGFVKHLRPENPVKGILRDMSGYLTSPLLYSDAKSKLTPKKP